MAAVALLGIFAAVLAFAGVFVLRAHSPVEPAFGMALIAAAVVVGLGAMNALVR